jgi:hypothetical protein
MSVSVSSRMRAGISTTLGWPSWCAIDGLNAYISASVMKTAIGMIRHGHSWHDGYLVWDYNLFGPPTDAACLGKYELHYMLHLRPVVAYAGAWGHRAMCQQLLKCNPEQKMGKYM